MSDSGVPDETPGFSDLQKLRKEDGRGWLDFTYGADYVIQSPVFVLIHNLKLAKNLRPPFFSINQKHFITQATRPPP